MTDRYRVAVDITVTEVWEVFADNEDQAGEFAMNDIGALIDTFESVRVEAIRDEL